ncbi:hypothetical protein Misp03_29690 [Microbispora sp. NBRC 16548]|nr:hypothetical protein Misp03_29690 [Microbispora sp. NBRC 16548]
MIRDSSRTVRARWRDSSASIRSDSPEPRPTEPSSTPADSRRTARSAVGGSACQAVCPARESSRELRSEHARPLARRQREQQRKADEQHGPPPHPDAQVGAPEEPVVQVDRGRRRGRSAGSVQPPAPEPEKPPPGVTGERIGTDLAGG